MARHVLVTAAVDRELLGRDVTIPPRCGDWNVATSRNLPKEVRAHVRVGPVHVLDVNEVHSAEALQDPALALGAGGAGSVPHARVDDVRAGLHEVRRHRGGGEGLGAYDHATDSTAPGVGSYHGEHVDGPPSDVGAAEQHIGAAREIFRPDHETTRDSDAGLLVGERHVGVLGER